jgi:hypothetical protein
MKEPCLPFTGPTNLLVNIANKARYLTVPTSPLGARTVSPTATEVVASGGDPWTEAGPRRATGLEGIPEGGVETAFRPRAALPLRETAENGGELTLAPREGRGRARLFPAVPNGAEGRRLMGVGVEYIFCLISDLLFVLQGLCWQHVRFHDLRVIRSVCCVWVFSPFILGRCKFRKFQIAPRSGQSAS